MSYDAMRWCLSPDTYIINVSRLRLAKIIYILLPDELWPDERNYGARRREPEANATVCPV